MADKRPFAKIDTGYALNPKWFRVEQAIRQHFVERPVEQGVEHSVQPDVERTVIRNAVRAAREAHLFSILYSAQNVTDGMFPVDVVKSLAVIQTDEEESAITALFNVGLWVNHPGGMAEVRDYLEHQTSSDQIKARTENARKAGEASAAKRTGGSTERSTGRSTGRSTSGSTKRSTEEKRREEKLTAESFAAWWAAYPRKDDRLKAEPAFSKALEKAEADELIKAAKEYAIEKQGVEKRFIKLPATWLNAGSWMNETTVAPPKRIVTAGEIPDDW